MKEMQIIMKPFRKRRHLYYLLGLAAMAGTGYGCYRLYKSPSIAKKKCLLIRFLTSVLTITEAASVSAEAVTLVSDDLKNFLQSDSDEIPTSLKQLFKVTRCREFQQTLTGVSGAVTAGILQGCGKSENGSAQNSVAERMMDKLFTPAGNGFVSVVVGSFARNLVLSFLEYYSAQGNTENLSNSDSGDSNPRPQGSGSGFVDVICSGKCRVLIAECIQRFVSTAVNVYLDKTMHINSYDEICSALTNPAHEVQMKGFLTSICNGAVDTLIKTSHEVLTSGQGSSNSSGRRVGIKSPTEGQGQGQGQLVNEKIYGPLIRCNSVGLSVGSQAIQLSAVDREHITVETNNVDCSGISSWIDKISYTLAIPSNRRLFLEVSGRMAFEAVRSLFEFTLFKFSEFFTRTLPEVSYEAVDKMLHIMRFVGAKSLVIATLCLAICLHVLTGISVLQVAQ